MTNKLTGFDGMKSNMQHSGDEYGRGYREKFRGVRPIIEKHFVGFEPKIITHMTHHFIVGEEVALLEGWNFKEQQRNLTKLRAQFQKAKISLEGIHLEVLREIYDNLTLPIEVLNGTKDRKTCDEEVFDLAPSREEVDAAVNVFRGLLAFSENIDKAIKYTQDELPFGIPVSNRNINGWRVVEAAVEVNRTYDCPIFIPKKIDGSGPMRELLVDLFEHYKITGTVDAAFNGWLQHIGHLY